MNWITPQLGGIVAAIAVPLLVILYFLKLRRQDLEVSSTFLWKKAIQDLQANAPFQKLRRNLLLFLQLLILGGLCFALAQPQVKGQAFVGNRHVILIDRSASMQSRDEVDGKGQTVSRFDAAKTQAVALVESLGEGGLLTGKDTADEAMIISFDSAAEVRQQFTTDKRALKAAIEALTPTEGPTLAEEAFRLAKQGYNLGRFPYMDVLNSQRTLFEVRERHIEALKDYHLKNAEIARLTAANISKIKNMENENE